MNDCILCGVPVHVGFTPNGRRVILERSGDAIPGEGRYLVDDDDPRTVRPVTPTYEGFAHRDHRQTCKYGLDR